MDSLEVNKAFAAVLVAGIVFVGAGQVGNFLVSPKRLETQAIKIDLPEKAQATAAGPAAPAPEPPIAVLLASADAGRGEAGIKSLGCVACHSLNEGGKHGVGPNLYNVMGQPHAAKEGYAYSNVLKAKEGPWNYEEMNAWLRKPSTYAPGTKMSYAGVGDPAKRADLILYLRNLSATPIPLPEAPAKVADATPAQPQQAAAPAPAAAAPAAPAATTAALPPAATPSGPVAGGAVLPIAQRLASADIEAGKSSTSRLGCVACHSVNEGGKNGVGPNLYGIMGNKIAAHEGYTYSNALKAKDGAWTFEEMDKWLLKPSEYAKGTKMSYAGIADAQVRANVIAYLRTLDATPEPLPAAN